MTELALRNKMIAENLSIKQGELGQRILAFEWIQPPRKAAAQLEITNTDQKVLRIKRLRFGDAEPIGIQDSYLGLSSEQSISQEEMETFGSIYAILQSKFGIFPTEAEETVEVTLATPEEADLLLIQVGSPLLLNVRTLWSQDRKAVEYVRILYRGDRYKYLVRLARKH